MESYKDESELSGEQERIAQLEAEVTQLKAENARLREEKAKSDEEKEQLKELAHKDPLTGIYNRGYFSEEYDKLVRSSEMVNQRQHKDDWTTAIFDIDHFKLINDKYGHPIGDLVLKQAAAELQELFREKDRVARYGGEEFSVVLESCDAYDILNRFIAQGKYNKDTNRVAIGFDFTHPQTKEVIKVNFSGGVKDFVSKADPNKPQKKISTVRPEEVIVRADEGLYMAKDRGRNNIVFEDISDREIAQLIKEKENAKKE